MTDYLRYLRIAFSATCVIVAVLVCALWMRSYSHYHGLTTSANNFELGSDYGNLAVFVAFSSIWEATEEHHWTFVNEWEPSVFQRIIPEDATPGLHCDNFGALWAVVPDWIVVSMLAALAAVPWFPFRSRFSLRTLLIATTLVALLLGLMVWLR